MKSFVRSAVALPVTWFRRQARGGDQQRVAVGPRFCDEVGRDVACGAGAIVDDDALAQRARHVLCELAGDDVVGGARTERNDDRDRLVRKILRACRGSHRHGCNGCHRCCNGCAPGPFRGLHERSSLLFDWLVLELRFSSRGSSTMGCRLAAGRSLSARNAARDRDPCRQCVYDVPSRWRQPELRGRPVRRCAAALAD